MDKAEDYIERMRKESPSMVEWSPRKNSWTAQWDQTVNDDLFVKEKMLP